MVNLDKDKNDKDATYKVEINVTTEDAVGMLDALNVLSSTNYYLEAVAGSIMSGGGDDAKACVAGSVAMLFFYNTVKATIGDHVKITLAGSEYEIWTDAKGNRYLVYNEEVYTLNDDGTLEDTGFTRAAFDAVKQEDKEKIKDVEYDV